MPLTRFTCPVDRHNYPLDECVRCAVHEGLRTDAGGRRRHCTIPVAAIVAISHGQDHRAGLGITSSQIGGCWRRAVFERTLAYAEYPDRRWPAEHGTAVHNHFETALKDVAPDLIWTETRVYKTLANGITISGEFDCWRVPLGRLEDYKVKDKVFSDPPREYVLQQNIYRWLLETGCTWRPDPEHQPDRYVPMPQPAVPITELWLWSTVHKGFQPVPCPLIDDDALERYLLDATAAMSADTPPETVPRAFAEPERQTLCVQYCPFFDECRMGSTALQPPTPVTPKRFPR